MAVEGQKDCIEVCKANGWALPVKGSRAFNALSSDARYDVLWTKEDKEEAQRDHVLAVVCTSSAFLVVEHKYYRRLCKKISKGRYRPPNRKKACNILRKLSEDIDDRKLDFCKKSQGSVIFDSAIGSKSEQFTNVFSENAGGRIFITLHDSSFKRKTAEEY